MGPAIPRGGDLARQVAAIIENIEIGKGLTGKDPGGNYPNRYITVNDLVTSGVVALKTRTGRRIQFPTHADFVTTGGAGALDSSTPPTPAGLTATAGLAQILVQWNQIPVGYTNPAYTEIWRNGVNDLGTATRVTTIPYPFVIWSDPIGQTGASRYYWIRFVSQANISGPFNAIAGVSATTGKAGTSDLGDYIITSQKIAAGAIDAYDKFGTGLRPVGIGNALPSLPSATYPAGAAFFLNTDQKMYRVDGTGNAWTKAVDGADITVNTITGNRIISGTISAGQVVAGGLAANTIVAGDGAIANLAITNALIGTAAVDDAKIANASVSKLTAGTITAAGIYVGDTHFLLDGSQGNLIISDGTYNRVKLGNLGLGAYGIEIRDGSNNIILNSGGTYGAAIANSAISISFSGVLSGAGGGSVLLGSLPGVAASTQMGAGVGVNQIPNSDSRFDSARHLFTWNDPAVSFGRNVASGWYLPGEGTLSLYSNNATALFNGTNIAGDIAFGTAGLSPTQCYKVIPGNRYEASAYTGVHRCACAIRIVYYDQSGAYILDHFSPQNTGYTGGNALAVNAFGNGYQRLTVFSTAPANAATALVIARKYTTTQGLGYTDSWMFVARAYFGEAYPNQTESSPWSGTTPGQFANLDQITSGNVGTYIASAAIGYAQIGSVNAATITVGQLTASQINVSSLSALSANLGTVTAGSIYTGFLQTAPSGSTGKRTVLDNSTNDIRFYNSANQLMAIVGDGNASGYNEAAYFGTSAAGNAKTGVFGDSNSNVGVYGRSVSASGVFAASSTGNGLSAVASGAGYGVYAESNSTAIRAAAQGGGFGLYAESVGGPALFASVNASSSTSANIRFGGRTGNATPSSPTPGDMVLLDNGIGASNNGLWIYYRNSTNFLVWYKLTP